MNLQTNTSKIALLIILMFGNTGCGEVAPSSTTSVTPVTPAISTPTTNTESTTPLVTASSGEVIDVAAYEYFEQKVDGNQSIQLKLGTEKKDVYLLFTNSTSTSIGDATVNNNSSNVTLKQNTLNIEKHYTQGHIPEYVEAFNNNFSHLKRKDNSEKNGIEKSFKSTTDLINDTQVFYMDESAQSAINATARKVVSGVVTAFGSKSLSIWVEDDSYGTGCKKSKCVTQVMVDTLAEKFLKEGLDNDIYDGVSNVFGEEWGSSNYSNLIAPEDSITILLGDISSDNATNGGIIGYFYSKDNLIKETISGSNERIMFYIDSVLYANGGNDEWIETDFWPKQVFATLAHEFQHMIHYYQKNISYEVAGTDKWINEMLSESVEDLMAVKMGLYGPRYVPASRGDAGDANNINGQFPLFNSTNSLDLSSWDNSLEDYSKVASFGAYLLRNYGGAELLHDIVHNQYTDKNAIMYAVHQQANGVSKTFDDLLHDWGIAVLMSNREDLPLDSGFLYNAGDYISNEYNGIQYDLGSINFFNYSPSPTLHSMMGTINAGENYYYKVGDKLTGDIDITLSKATDLTISVVVVK